MTRVVKDAKISGVAHLWYAPKSESTNKTYDLSRLSVHQDK